MAKAKYSATVWKGSKKVLFTKYVPNPKRYVNWLKARKISFDYVNFYDRKTYKYHSRIYR